MEVEGTTGARTTKRYRGKKKKEAMRARNARRDASKRAKHGDGQQPAGGSQHGSTPSY